jgi:hypothetical protein
MPESEKSIFFCPVGTVARGPPTVLIGQATRPSNHLNVGNPSDDDMTTTAKDSQISFRAPLHDPGIG